MAKPGSDDARKLTTQARNGQAPSATAMATTIVAFVNACVATPGSHPATTEELLDLRWATLEGGQIVLRFPNSAWPEIRAMIDEIHDAIAEHPDLAAKARRAGIHLPDGVDVDAEAKAQDELRGGTPSDDAPGN